MNGLTSRIFTAGTLHMLVMRVHMVKAKLTSQAKTHKKFTQRLNAGASKLTSQSKTNTQKIVSISYIDLLLRNSFGSKLQNQVAS